MGAERFVFPARRAPGAARPFTARPGSGTASRAWLGRAETEHCSENKNQCVFSHETPAIPFPSGALRGFVSSPTAATPGQVTGHILSRPGSHRNAALGHASCFPTCECEPSSHLYPLWPMFQTKIRGGGYLQVLKPPQTAAFHHITHTQFLMTDLLVFVCRGEKLCSYCFAVPKYFTGRGTGVKRRLEGTFYKDMQ